MRYAIRGLMAFCVLVSSTLSVGAGCNVVQSAYYPTYSVPYVAPYVAPVKVVNNYNKITVFDLNPGVAVGYLYPYAVPAVAAPAMPAPAAAPHQTPCESKLAEFSAKLALLEARLGVGSAPAAGVQPSPPAAPAPPPMAPVPPLNGNGNGAAKSPFTLRCAGCHDASVANAKGGKLTMFQNGLALQLPPETANKAIRLMMRGEMPPPRSGTALTDKDFTAILDELLGVSERK